MPSLTSEICLQWAGFSGTLSGSSPAGHIGLFLWYRNKASRIPFNDPNTARSVVVDYAHDNDGLGGRTA